MRILIQRVREARVEAAGQDPRSIGRGLLLLVGVGLGDEPPDVERVARKAARLRIFEDETGKMNWDAKQAGGSILSVPQFTLYADVSRGNRPGFEEAAGPEKAETLWKRFNRILKDEGLTVQEGFFGAKMQVHLINEGPVTLSLDSKAERGRQALDVLAERHSARQFEPDPVPKEVIEEIVNAGRLAATARNLQPWEFVVFTNKERRKRVAEMAEHGKFIADAPACVAVFCRDTKYYLEDGCAATQNMLVAAEALGVQSCWVAGDKKSYTRDIAQLLGVPEPLKLVSLVALGYEKGPAQRPPKRSLPDVLHWEKYS